MQGGERKGFQRCPKTLEDPRQIAELGVDQEERHGGRRQGRTEVGGAELARGDSGQLLDDAWGGVGRGEVRREAEDRQSVPKARGLVNFVAEDEAK